MDQASELEPQIIGINNRDLSDLSIDLETTARLSKHAPKKSLVVSESGYHTRGQVARMEKFCDAFLIGSALMRGSVRGMIHELQGREGEV
jgi:indole-3-glycerol phosphate synthase/phosphoribosylanthranilate isomerase